jgi:hypothetical protein
MICWREIEKLGQARINKSAALKYFEETSWIGRIESGLLLPSRNIKIIIKVLVYFLKK